MFKCSICLKNFGNGHLIIETAKRRKNYRIFKMLQTF